MSSFLRIKSGNIIYFLVFLRLQGLLAEQIYCVPCSFCCHSLATVKRLEKVSIAFYLSLILCFVLSVFIK